MSMGLGNIITTGESPPPFKALIYGPEGVGKTSFVAGAPDVIYIDVEDGTNFLPGVSKFPVPGRYEDIIEALGTLYKEKHSYKTLVIDTIDKTQEMMFDFCCREDGKSDIMDFGFGKGLGKASTKLEILLNKLERLSKKMNTVLLAHSVVKTFINPEGDDYDRYQPNLYKSNSVNLVGKVTAWADVVGFANFQTLVKKDTTKGIDVGERLLHLERTAAYDAKCRWPAPQSVPLVWEDFIVHYQKSSETTKEEKVAVEKQDSAVNKKSADGMIKEIKTACSSLSEPHAKKVTDALGRAGNNESKLFELLEWVQERQEAQSFQGKA